MAFGVKTNEREGVRAQARYLRVSAYKARAVLDLIRGEPVARAFEILELADRAVAAQILKCLESAVANAEHNNAIPADELYVSACFADEGPTLKRWRPRARGRATRIRKRTCHITVIVSRMAPEELERQREREASGGRARGNRAAAEARRQRVLRSRQSKAEKRAAEEEAHEHDHDHDHDEEAAAVAEAAEEAGAVDPQAEELAQAVEDDTTEADDESEAEPEAAEPAGEAASPKKRGSAKPAASETPQADEEES
jgi:large subunit ribosomal protein L22